MRTALHLCVLALATGFVTDAATLEQLSMDQMTDKATSIVRATVAGSYANVINSTVYTHYTLRTSESLKGGMVTEVMMPGGVAGNLRQTFPGVPELKTGREYLLFVWRSSTGITHLLGLSQGVFEVTQQADGSTVASRGKIGEMMLDARGNKVADRAVSIGVADLRARLHSKPGIAVK